jgi:hypothetical protein
VADELDSAVEEADVERGLARLAYHVENYLNHIYELRERAIRVVAALTGQPKEAEKLKKPELRAAAIGNLRSIDAAQAGAISDLLNWLQADIDLRNQNTHDTHLRLGLNTGDDIHDPHDALLAVKSQPVHRRALEKVLRQEMKPVAEEYRDKVSIVVSLTLELLRQTHPVKAS